MRQGDFLILDNYLIILYNLFNGLIFAERKQNAEVALMIDFSLSEEQLAVQKMARDFAQKEILPEAADFDRSGDYPRNCKKAFKPAWFTERYARRIRWRWLGAFDQLLVAEELSAGCAGIGSCIAINSLAAIPLIYFGSEEQKRATARERFVRRERRWRSV
jgi:alkylation response protein AidB-like acyl-CoA dehydrogenase